MHNSWTRQIHLSSGYRYGGPKLSQEESQAIYGKDFSLTGLGYNLSCEITVEPLVQEDINKAWAYLESALKDKLDHRFLNEEVEAFRDQPMSLENISRFVFELATEKMTTEARVLKVRVAEGINRWVEFNGKLDQVLLVQVYKLQCLHRHHNPELSKQENQELFGKCSGLHGHEYSLEVGVAGRVDERTGLVATRHDLDQWVETAILKPFDKTFLNDHLGNTSGEIIVLEFYRLLSQVLPSSLGLSLRVRETRKNSFVIPNSYR